MRPVEGRIVANKIPHHFAAALSQAGMNLSDIARRLGRDRSEISRAARGERQNYRLREQIAGILGQPLDRLWPDG